MILRRHSLWTALKYLGRGSMWVQNELISMSRQHDLHSHEFWKLKQTSKLHLKPHVSPNTYHNKRQECPHMTPQIVWERIMQYSPWDFTNSIFTYLILSDIVQGHSFRICTFEFQFNYCSTQNMFIIHEKICTIKIGIMGVKHLHTLSSWVNLGLRLLLFETKSSSDFEKVIWTLRFI